MQNTTLSFSLKLTALILFLVCTSAIHAEGTINYATDHIIAKFKSGIPQTNNAKVNAPAITGISSLDALNTKYGCSSVEKLLPAIKKNDAEAIALKLDQLAIIKFSSSQNIPELVKEYTATGLFEYVEPDYIGSVSGVQGMDITVNDAAFSKQWSLQNNGTFTPGPSKAGADIKMLTAWNFSTGSTNVIVGIIDSGTKLDHPELSGRIWTNTKEIAGNGVDDDANGYIDDTMGGWDFVNNDNNPTDDNGHGTNVTGIIGANGNNGTLFAGMDWNCKLMSAKGTNSGGTGLYSGWASGIHYCVDNGARIINMSLEGTASSQALEDAVTYAYNKNVLCVVCMGNYNSSAPSYPAACTHSFGVGATNSSDNRCNPFAWGGGSDFGPNTKVVAPGNYIYGLQYNSNTSSSYYWSGTSQAAPHVTGLASLLLAQNPSRTADQLANIIEVTADDQVGLSSEDTPGWDQYYGYGRINAYKALSYASVGINQKAEIVPQLTIYPNPFTAEVNLKYVLSKPSNVKIEITDLIGQQVLLINKGVVQTGNYLETWGGESNTGATVSPGFYLVTLIANDSERTSFKMAKQ